MTTATTERGRRTRAKILSTAADLFHRRGVNATSVDDVLEASGAGKSQFYHYFESKDDLMREVVRFHLEQYLATCSSLSKLDSFKSIRCWFDSMIRMQQESKCVGGCPVGSMASELSDTNPVVRKECAAVMGELQKRLQKGLAAMKSRKEIRPDSNPKVLAEFAMASLQGAMLMAKTTKSIPTLRSILRETLRHLESFSN